MRIKKLTMTAFGPYAGTEVIDFSHLCDAGIFLITGNTGSGKTMIFDAIAYALFGEASSSERNHRGDLRSTIADPKTKTSVELIFELNGKEYKVVRTPSYDTTWKKTNQSAEATLSYFDGTPPVTKEKSVTEAIQTLLGINYEQFCQIAMIAQGKFRNVLSAPTKDRIEIFRQAFGTDLYKNLQERFAEDAKQIREKEEGLVSEAKFFIKSVGCPEAFQEDWNNLAVNPELPDLKAVLPLLKKICEDNAKEQDIWLEKRKVADVALIVAKDVLKSAKRQHEEREILDQQKKNFDIESKNLQIFKERKDEAVANQPKIDAINADIAKLIATLPEYEKLDAELKNMNRIRKELSQKKDEYALLNSKLEKNRQDLQAEKEELAGIADVGAEVEALKNQRDKLRSDWKQLNSIYEFALNLPKANANLSKADLILKKAQELANTALKKSNALNLAFLQGQSVLLSKTLEEGKPCPVCGSKNHPDPAHMHEDIPIPTKKDVDVAIKELNMRNDEFNEATSEYTKAKTEVEHIEATLARMLNERGVACSICDAIDVLQTKKNEIESKGKKIRAEQDDAEAKMKRRVELSNLIPNHEREVDAMLLSVTNMRSEISALSTAETSAVDSCAKQMERCEFANKGLAEARIAELKSDVAKIKAEIDLACTSYDNARQKCDSMRGAIDAMTDRLSKEKPIDFEVANKSAEEAQKNRDSIDAPLSHIGAIIERNRVAFDKIVKLSNDINKIHGELLLKEELSRVSNGNVGHGVDKITLEAYAQTTYFEMILSRANDRLLKMSKGQYEMRRRLDNDKKTVTGLDINVLDHFNGSIRPVGTLSGGESFIAALALALGFSDEITRKSADIHMDTLFVDEGFGSLDDGALMLAIDTLKELSKCGGRSIGIISHVSDLKRCIDSQLVVTRDMIAGSSTHVRA